MIAAFPVWLLWLLPVLFLLHDLEETLFLPGWLRRNGAVLSERFPALARRLLPHFEKITPRLFAVMAAEEFLLLAGVTIYAVAAGDLLPWLALFLAFAIHLLLHVAQWLALRRYIPVIGTTLVCLPVCGYLFYRMTELFSPLQIVTCATIGMAAAAVNLWLIHRLTARYARR